MCLSKARISRLSKGGGGIEMDGKIHIPARRVSLNPQGVIKITPEAFEALAEVMNETGMSARQAASTIITQAVNNDLIVYDREE